MADNLQLLCEYLESNSRKIYPYFLNSNNVIKKFTEILESKRKVWKENSAQNEKFCEICGHSSFDANGEDSSCLAAKWTINPLKSVISLEKIQVLCCNCFLLRDGLALLRILNTSYKPENTEKVNVLASHLSQLIDINLDNVYCLQQIISVSYSIGVLLKTLPNIKVTQSNGEPLNDRNIAQNIEDFIINSQPNKSEGTTSSIISSSLKTPKAKKRKLKESGEAKSDKKKKEKLSKKKRRQTIV